MEEVEIQPVAEDIASEVEEEKGGTLELQEFERDLLVKPATKYHFAGSDFDAFKDSFETSEAERDEAVGLALRGEEMTQSQQEMVQKELARRQLAKVWPDVTGFVAKLKGQGGETAELVKKAMKDGKPEMLAFMLLQVALQAKEGEQVGEAKPGIALVGGHELHDFEERMRGREVKSTGSEADRMASIALKMFGVFGTGKLALKDESMKKLTGEAMLRKLLGLT